MLHMSQHLDIHGSIWPCLIIHKHKLRYHTDLGPNYKNILRFFVRLS